MLNSLKSLVDTDILSLLTPKRQLVGLDIGSSGIKLVQLKENRGRYILQKFGFKPLEPEVIVDGTVMDEGRVVSAIRELFNELSVKVKQVAVSISGHAVIIKKISLPPMPDDELEGQVKLAAEQYIPFDINEVNIDFHVLPAAEGEASEGEMSVILVAAKKDKINELTELVKGAGLVPMVMDVDAFAIENMHAINYPMSQDETTALVNVGASVMNINIVSKGTSLFTRDIPIGGNRYTESIQRELGLSYEDAEALKKGGKASGSNQAAAAQSVIESVNAEVASEIARTIDYFKSTVTEGEVQQVLLCGGGAQIAGLVKQLRDRMHAVVEVANPFAEVDTSGSDFDQAALADLAPMASVGVGLALRSVGDR
ncbi:MAG TPA: type IV pilus assembly protein PilM [Nitrospira sp.]|jgi:type IV pilus assembly protein PilM|nr:type IV pilus assembly protein PilM [Nitrospira sp.]